MVIILLSVSCAKKNNDTSSFPKGTKAPNTHHTGEAWLNRLSTEDSIFKYNLVTATFAADSKLDWHKHPDGQQLLILEGEGYYQERGKSLQTIKKGDVIKSLPGVEHWHSSTPNSSCTYLAIYGGAPTQWLEKLTDSVYYQLKN